MEHEIFNSDDETIVKQKTEKKTGGFWHVLFSCEFLATFFAILSLALSGLTRFLAFMGLNGYVSGIFFLLSFGCAFAGIILEIIPMVKKRKMAINLQLILNLFALLISVL